MQKVSKNKKTAVYMCQDVALNEKFWFALIWQASTYLISLILVDLTEL